MNQRDYRDWYLCLHLGAIIIASTTFVFLHPEHFPAYGMLMATVTSLYQALAIHDDKVPDASPPKADPS